MSGTGYPSHGHQREGEFGATTPTTLDSSAPGRGSESPGSDVENSHDARRDRNTNTAAYKRPLPPTINVASTPPASNVSHLISSDSESEDENRGEENRSVLKDDEEESLGVKGKSITGTEELESVGYNRTNSFSDGCVHANNPDLPPYLEKQEMMLPSIALEADQVLSKSFSLAVKIGKEVQLERIESATSKTKQRDGSLEGVPPKIKRHGPALLSTLTLGGPANLMVSPEVLGRLRRVQEGEDEGRYSQSSASEYMSGWGGETDETMTTDDSSAGEDDEVKQAMAPKFGSAWSTEDPGHGKSASRPGSRGLKKKSTSPPPTGWDAAQEVAWSAWTTCETDEGIPYYFNDATGESQWESPFPMPPRSAKNKDRIRSYSSLSNSSVKSQNSISALQKPTTVSPAPNDDADESEFSTPQTLAQHRKTHLTIQTKGLYVSSVSSSSKRISVNDGDLVSSPSVPFSAAPGPSPYIDSMRTLGVVAMADTPLHGAVSYNYINDDYVQKLLRNGADPNSTDARAGRTPLHIAASQGYFAGMEMLFKAGADPLALDAQGNTVMHHACKGGNGKYSVDVASYLKDMGVPLDEQSLTGNTPLHLAAVVGDLPCVQYLLEFGASPHKKNIKGEAPAHSAARNGHASCIVQLAEYGAALDVKTNHGLTVQDMAIEAGKKWCAERVALLPMRMPADQVRRPVGVPVQSSLAGPSPFDPANTRHGNVSHLISSDSDSETAGINSPPQRGMERFSTPESTVSNPIINTDAKDTPNPLSPVRGGMVDRGIHEALVAQSMAFADENKELKTRLELVEEELDKVRRELRERSTVIRQKSDEIVDLRKNAIMHEEKIEKFKVELDKKSREIKLLEEDKHSREEALTNSLNALRMDFRGLEVVHTSTKSELVDVRTRLRAMEQERDILSQQVSDFGQKGKDIEILQSSLTSAEESIKSQTIQYAAALEQYERRLSVTLSKTDDSDSRIEELEAALAVAQSELEKKNRNVFPYEQDGIIHDDPPRPSLGHDEYAESGVCDVESLKTDNLAHENHERLLGGEATFETDMDVFPRIKNGDEIDSPERIAGALVETLSISGVDVALSPQTDGEDVNEESQTKKRTVYGNGGEALSANQILPVNMEIDSLQPAEVKKEIIAEEKESHPTVVHLTHHQKHRPVEDQTFISEEGRFPYQDYGKTKNDIVEHDHPPPPEQNPVQSFVGDVSGGVYANADDLPVKTANTDVSDWVAQPDGQTEYQVPRGMSSNAMDGFYTEGGEVDINMWSAYSHDNSSWVGYTSADGAVYYYNTQTGESSWDKPPGVPPIDNGGGQDFSSEKSNEPNFNEGSPSPREWYNYEDGFVTQKEQAQENAVLVRPRILASERSQSSEGVPVSDSQASQQDLAESVHVSKVGTERVGDVWGRFFENAALSAQGKEMRKTNPLPSPPHSTRKKIVDQPSYLLHDACSHGNVDRLSVLYSQGMENGEEFDIDMKDQDGNAPLHIAVNAGELECTRFLLQSAAFAEVRDIFGNTAFHIAAKQGNILIAKLLVEYGARIDARNDNGETVVDTALTAAMRNDNPSSGLMETIELLRRVDAGEEEGSSSVNESIPSSDEMSDTKPPSDDGMVHMTQDGGEENSWKFWGMISTVGAFFGNIGENGNIGSTENENGCIDGTTVERDGFCSGNNRAPSVEKKAVVANLGNESKFVYDKEKKMWVNSLSGEKAGPVSPRTPKRNRRPFPIDLPPTDEQLGPTPPSSISPRTARRSNSSSPSFKSMLVPPPGVALALAMGGAGKSPGSPRGSPRQSSLSSNSSIIAPLKLNLSDTGSNMIKKPIPEKPLTRAYSEGQVPSLIKEGNWGGSEEPVAIGMRSKSESTSGSDIPSTEKKNRFSIASRRGSSKSIRSRYVDTFNDASDGKVRSHSEDNPST